MSAPRRQWRPFARARAFARGLGLDSHRAWRRWARSRRRPADIPSAPDLAYRDDGWISWADWLGSDHVAPSKRAYDPFAVARAFVRRLGLRSGREWAAWASSAERPATIPANPRRTYLDDGWQGWGDWLGTDSVAPGLRRYRAFAEARRFVRQRGLSSHREWRRWAQSAARPDDIPVAPDLVYRERGWISWGDWLGTNHVAPRRRNER